jgi:hypothetical protein
VILHQFRIKLHNFVLVAVLAAKFIPLGSKITDINKQTNSMLLDLLEDTIFIQPVKKSPAFKKNFKFITVLIKTR